MSGPNSAGSILEHAALHVAGEFKTVLACNRIEHLLVFVRLVEHLPEALGHRLNGCTARDYSRLPLS